MSNEMQPGGLGADFILHPLIHSLLKFKLAQDVEKKKAEFLTPHFFSLSQYVVGCF